MCMAYSQPSLLSDALCLRKQAGVRVIAGGTDFYPALRPGEQTENVLDITRVGGLSDIKQTEDATRFGAAATWSNVVRADLPAAFDALKQAAREVGSLQIQNAGTIAGNICNASPAADGVPPLLALNAEVELASAARGTRILPLGEFITGVRQTVLKEDELVTAIIVPKQHVRMTSGFEKLGSRRYLVISIAMTAVNILLDAQGKIADARVAVGSCSAVAQRLTALEARLIGQDPYKLRISQDDIASLTPIDDVRGAASYRFDAVRHQVQRAIHKAVTS
ncbi:xanthine dehydrogenase family protein subunit M [Ruegeria sp. HKCCD7318]|nr:xanthine dehydrogenase family protein subunit M [Ruegeria sp. HKCCD7318]